MRRLQLPRVVCGSKAFAGALVLFALVFFAPAAAQAQLTITSGSSYGTFSIGEVDLQLSASGGMGPLTWSVVGGTLPPGLAVRYDLPPFFPPSASAGIIGLATVPGNYSFDVQVTDGVTTSAPQTVTVTITSLSITTPHDLPDAFLGSPYSVQLEADGGAGALTWSAAGSLPGGLSLSSTGVLSGSPSATGYLPVPFSVTDGTNTVYWTLNVNVTAVRISTDGQLPFAVNGVGYNTTIAASGGTAPYSFQLGGGAPFGLSIDSGGNLSWASPQQGRWTFQITAIDSGMPNLAYSKNFSLVVTSVPAQMPQLQPYGQRLDDCTVGVNCTRAIGNWSPAQPPFTWAVSGLPSGMGYRTGSGVASTWVWPGDVELYGVPLTSGNYSVTVTVTDGTGAQATNTFPLRVSRLNVCCNPPNGAIGAPLSHTFRLIGGNNTYSSALTSGALPLGLSYDGGTRTITGTPTEGGWFNPRITFSDTAGNALDYTSGFFIANAGNTSQTINIFDGDLGTIQLSQPWSRQLNACCRASITWSLEAGSSLPAGISLSTGGLLSGTPTASGQFTFVVRAADPAIPADYTTRQLTLIVSPVFVTTSFTLPFGNAGTFYSQQLQASGGTGPYTWALQAGTYLPPGLSLTSGGLLSGTPTGTGQFFFNVDVVDTVTLNRAVGYFGLAIYPAGAFPPLQINTNGNFGTWSIGSIQTELSASGGSGGYVWSVVAGTLPPGMEARPDGPSWFSPSASAGLIGVATTPAPTAYTFTLRVTDSTGHTADLPSSMTIVPLTIKDLWNFKDGFVGTPYSHTLTPLGNVGAVTWGVNTCGGGCPLPAGLTFNTTTGTLSGTPTTPGFYNLSISMSADGATVSWNVSVAVFAIDVGTSTPLAGGDVNELPNATPGVPYSATFTASGGTPPYTFSVSGQPNGLSMDPSSGVLSGTSNSGGRFWMTVTATDSTATSYSRAFSVRFVSTPTVLPSIGINGQRFDDCTIGMGCNRGFWVSSSVPAPFTWSAAGLPAGMSLRPGGVAFGNDHTPAGDAVIWGVPTEAGDFNVTITVTDANSAQTSVTVPLHVSELWLETRLPNGTYGTTYGPTPPGTGAHLRVLGGSAHYTTALVAQSPGNRLPAGLTLDGALDHNTVTGTPIETGSFSPDLLVTDTAGPAHHLRIFNGLFIADSGIGTIQINTGSDLGYVPVGTVPFTTFTACCVPSILWSLESGTLPAGTSLVASGNNAQLSGTFTTAGTYVFALRARNAIDAANFAVRQFTIVVSPMTQATGGGLPFGNLGVPYGPGGAGVQLQANGGTGATSFALATSNNLPPGLTLSSGGLLSGTPTSTGQYSFSVIASDTASHTVRMNFTLSIYPAGDAPPLNLVISSVLGPFAVGQITQALGSNASGGRPPYHFSVTPLAPVVPGMRVQDGYPLPTNYISSVFNPVPTASFIGVVDTPGDYPTSIRLTDADGRTFDKAFTVRVSPLNINQISPLPKATVGSPYSFTFTATGGSGNYQWAGIGLPGGLSISTDAGTHAGILSGSPTTAGSQSFSVTVTDLTLSTSVTLSFSLTRNAFSIDTSGLLPSATIGVSYPSVQLTTTGCAGCTFSTPNGGLPNGLTLSGAGLISGTPGTGNPNPGPGTFSFVVRATSGGGTTVDKLFSIVVASSLPQALVITTGPTFGATTVGFTATNQLTAVGGTPPYAWSLAAGALPSGISLVNAGDVIDANLNPLGYLLGKPRLTGTYAFTLQVTDSVGATATKALSWNISALNLQYTNLPLKDQNGNPFGPAPTLNRGSAYDQPMLAIGGTGNYTWTATMPAGLTLNAAGHIVGTPIDSGSFTVPITITDDGGHSVTTNENLTISAGGGPSFGANSTQGPFALGSTVSVNLSPTGGTAPYTVTALTALPPGFTILSGDAVLSGGTPGTTFSFAGTPLASGVSTFTLQVQDSLGATGQRTFTMTIAPVAILTGTTLTDASVGAPYSAQLVAFDNVGAFTWTLGPGAALPAGLSLSPAGLLSGTPTAAGNYSFALRVIDAATGLGGSTTFSLKVSPLAITGPDVLPLATVLQPYTYTFGVTGASGPVTWSIPAGLPNGLSASGPTISGTPLNGNSFTNLVVTATSGGNSVTRRVTLLLRAQGVIPPGLPSLQTALPDGAVGQTYQATIAPNSGLGPFSLSVAAGSSLPPGLTLITGAQLPPTSFPGATVLAGQPTAAGQYSFDLVITDAGGATAVRTFSVHVSSMAILSGSLRIAIAGQAYSQQVTAVGGTPPYTFTASLPPNTPTADLLPPGLTLSSTGLISGTTTSTGNYVLVVRAQDAAGNSFARTFTLTVTNSSGLRTNTANPNDVYVGSGFSQFLSAVILVGNNTLTCACSWSVSGGTVPPGLSIVTDPMDPGNVTLTGQPSVAGIYTYTLRATETATPGNFADHTFTMNVSPMQVVSPPLLRYVIPFAQVGAPYSTSFKVAGGTPPYTFSPSPAGPVPPGLTLASDGTLSGTPTQGGLFSIGVIATDAVGRVYHLPFPGFLVTATGATPPLLATQNSALVDDASVGVPYRLPLVQQRAGTPPFSWAVSAGSSLPPGMTIVAGSNGVADYLTGVPTTAGSYTFVLTATDALAQTVSASYALTVSPLSLTPDSLAPGRVGVPYSASLAPVGGVGPYTMQAVSTWDLPPGLTLSAAGVLSGTPTAAGVFIMRVQVNDNASHTLSKLFVIDVDNAIGESPAVTLSPRSIQLSYTQTFADPGPIAVAINTTSGTPAYNVAIEGIPGATLSTGGGNAPDAVSLDLHLTTLAVGNYSGVLALKTTAPNTFDAIPVNVTVAPVPPCNYVLSPGSTSVAAAGGSSTFDLATAGHCSWSASVSQPWISLTTSSSGTGAATIGYSVTLNAAASARSGTITINGSVYTITQFGSDCSFAINPLGIAAPASGGSVPVSVSASDSICSWTATSATLGLSTGGGTGDGSVTVTIPSNPDPGLRVLTATIGGQTFTVNQSGIDCTVSLDTTAASFADSGGIGSVAVTTPAACGYSTTSNPGWVSIDSGGSGIGPGTLQYTVTPNSATTPRTGSIIVGGQALAISQGAAACSVTLDTSTLAGPYGSGGGSGAIGVITNGDNCAWSVTSSANWATFAPSAASGSGVISVNIAANPLVTPRSATLLIAGQAVMVAQAGAACTFALQSAAGSVPAAGGSGTVGVLTPAACTWTPVSSDPGWLTAGAGGSGSGDAAFIATANPDPTPRSATITIAANVFTVTQPAAACTFTLGAPAITVSGDGVVGATVAVSSASAACVPAPVSYASWLTVDNTSFSGVSGTITYSVLPNPLATSRTGVMQVGDQTFTVTETLSSSACRYSLHAYGAVFNRGGGGGDVFGSPSALGCDPSSTIGTDQPSFILLGPLSGPVLDIFTQPFTVSPFDTSLTAVIRRGRITFGGQIFVVKQVSW